MKHNSSEKEALKRQSEGFAMKDGGSAEGSAVKKSKHSLKWKLFISFFLFSLLMIIILWLFQTVFLDSFYQAIKTKNISSCAQSIEENINNPDIGALVEAIGNQNDTCILLCSPQKNGDYGTLASVSVNSACMIHGLTTEQLDEIYSSAKLNGGYMVEFFSTSDDDALHFEESDTDSDENTDKMFVGNRPALEKSNTQSLVYVSLFKNSDGREYMLLLNSIVTPITSTVDTLRYQLVIISVFLLVLSVIISIVSSRLIAIPIEQVTKSAKELGEGNYDVKFNGSGYKEVTQLSETLNYAAMELSQVDQMRKDLIANVSHDLRTPLTLIAGYGEVMRDIPGENTAENIQIIIDEATRLKGLVNDLIDISKIEAGTMKLAASTFCITDTIEEMFERYNKLKEQDGFTFDFEHDCKVYVYADQLKISQVIYNLVNNAVNYSGDNRNIIIRQICYDNRVRIEVVDHGPGIPQEKLKSIWDRYYKVDKSHKSAKIGTGLGLSIVKSVLKLHRAQFGVFSTVGKGSTFWFELYRTDENGEPL